MSEQPQQDTDETNNAPADEAQQSQEQQQHGNQQETQAAAEEEQPGQDETTAAVESSGQDGDTEEQQARQDEATEEHTGQGDDQEEQVAEGEHKDQARSAEEEQTQKPRGGEQEETSETQKGGKETSNEQIDAVREETDLQGPNEDADEQSETPQNLSQLKDQLYKTLKRSLLSQAAEKRETSEPGISIDSNLTRVAGMHASHLAENAITGSLDRYGRSIRQRYGCFLAAEGSHAYVSEISYGCKMTECAQNLNEIPSASTVLTTLLQKKACSIGKLVSQHALRQAYDLPGGDEVDFENLNCDQFTNHWLSDPSISFLGIGIAVERPVDSEGAFKLSQCNIRVVEAFGRRQFDIQSIQLSPVDTEGEMEGEQPVEDQEVDSLVGVMHSNHVTYNLRMKNDSHLTILSAIVKKQMSIGKPFESVHGCPRDKDNLLEPTFTEAKGLIEQAFCYLYDPYRSGTAYQDTGLVEVERIIYPWQIIHHEGNQFSVPVHVSDPGLYYVDFIADKEVADIPRNEQEAPDKTAKELQKLYSNVNSVEKETTALISGSVAIWILPSLDWTGWNTYKARGRIVNFSGRKMEFPHYIGEGSTNLFYGEPRYGPASASEEDKEDEYLSFALKDIYPSSAVKEEEFSGYRNQTVLLDHDWVKDTPLEELPTTGPHCYGRNRHINLSSSIGGDGTPISDIDIIFCDEGSAYEEVEKMGESWEVVHVNLTPFIVESETFKEKFSDDVTSFAKDNPCFLVIERSARSPIFDAGIGIETSEKSVPKIEGYSWKKYECNFGFASCTLVLLFTSELEAFRRVEEQNHSIRSEKMREEDYDESVHHEEFESGSSMAETPRDDGDFQETYSRKMQIISELGELDEKYENLTSSNETLQKKLAQYFSIRQSSDEVAARTAGVGGSDQGGKDREPKMDDEKKKKYQEQLTAIAKQQVKMSEAQASFDSQSLELQGRLDIKDQQAREIADRLYHWKKSVAKSAISSKTGKSLPRSTIDTILDQNEPAKEKEVETVRVRHIHLKNQLDKLEKQLKEKEQLADGLALIDFEQLKIENSTLNEKIEDRNEELHKLRKKTTTTVQVLTHVKEKLQFVASEANRLKQELSGVEEEVTQQRDLLAKRKHKREEIRQDIDQKRSQQSFAHSDLLAKDFEYRKQKIDEYSSRLDNLKERHKHISQKVKSLTSKRNMIEKELQAALG